MEYKELLQGIIYSGSAPKGQCSGVAQDSRKVKPGFVFVCIEGRSSNGHEFAQKALDAGAGMIVSRQKLGLPCEVVVEDTRSAYAQLCQNFFGRPAEKLTLVAVTGTNGKTTVASVLKQTLENLGIRCGLVGTNQNSVGRMQLPSRFTTPEAWELAVLFDQMLKAGCTHVVMEASSQALEQGRLMGLRFALGIFTNLSLDHLDYHSDMEQYFSAKRLLFLQSDALLANFCDPYGQRLLQDEQLKNSLVDVQSFAGRGANANFEASDVQLSATDVRFTFNSKDGAWPVEFCMPGAYSVDNATAAIAAAIMLGQSGGAAATALSKSQGVQGRCEVLHKGSYTVVRDFAHTADAMHKLLSSLKQFTQGRLVVLFGCAGMREATKRADMSRAALRYADEIVLTADNPREEPMEKIFADSLPPLQQQAKVPYTVEPNREAAIHFALGRMQKGDMLVLCGKGHEDYQALNGYTVYLNERDIVQQWQQQNG